MVITNKNKFEIQLFHALIISSFLHLLFIAPFSETFKWLHFTAEDENVENIEVEFEFYQAKPQEEKHFFIPKGISLDNINKSNDKPREETEADVSSAIDSINIHENIPEPDFGIEKEEDLIEQKLETSLEEQTYVEKKDEKTSDSLESAIELDEIRQTEKIKFDYGLRIRTLIENHANLPDSLVGKNITDIVKVEITLNKDGKLTDNTPIILQDEFSVYPEINEAALAAVKKASAFFPPIPERYKKDK
ncbi:MAG: hypothetical protein ACD_79C01020G0002, partial [uncultured bacterium]